MSAENINSLWCDDITFCPLECERLDCQRNQKNIRDRTIPHSYSLEIPEDCLKIRESVKPAVSTVQVRCGGCRKIIEMDGWKYCPWCGKGIKWN